MTRVADDDNSVIYQPDNCEIRKALSGGEGEECHNSGEILYRDALLCEAHATLLKLQDRAAAVLDSVFRMDEWMEGNGGDRNGSASADEEFVGRIRYERDEAVGALRPMRGQIRSARKALEYTSANGDGPSGG
jgi:hypothetical protein